MALPRTLGELQLYRVLQRANLLGYYETFIQQGGDDVQQLCEAGEEEFLEIMALVGMATKPLHVRRLQKALREWASNPGLFSQPVSAVPVSSIPLFKLSEAGGRKALSNGHASPGEAAGKGGSSAGTPPARSPTEPGEKLSPSAAPPWPGRSTPESEGGGDEEPGGPPFSPSGSSGEQAAGTELEPELARTVVESVERLLQSCPRGGEAELRALMKLNKKLAKAVGHIFQLEDGDRQKEEEIRRHSAIYGRGEARRREGKQLTLHEVSSVLEVPAMRWVGTRTRGSSGGVGGWDSRSCSHPGGICQPKPRAAWALPSLSPRSRSISAPSSSSTRRPPSSACGTTRCCCGASSSSRCRDRSRGRAPTCPRSRSPGEARPGKAPPRSPGRGLAVTPLQPGSCSVIQLLDPAPPAPGWGPGPAAPGSPLPAWAVSA